MKRIMRLFLCLIFTLCISGCGKEDELKDFSKQCAIDLAWGDIISSEDTYGEFHGDGYSVTIVQYSDGSVCEEMEESEYWHSLPLPENLQTFVYQPYDDGISIPEVKNGYYYFYDRHPEAANPYDDAELLNRYSLNFTFAIYDLDSNILYLCRYDT